VAVGVSGLANEKLWNTGELKLSWIAWTLAAVARGSAGLAGPRALSQQAVTTSAANTAKCQWG
jgi:hypothetical protein